jgi:CheY-like chemotaxis protein
MSTGNETAVESRPQTEKSASILLVEDDDFIRQEISEALEDEGYQVATAAHGKEALALLADGVKPQVVLLDLMMPVMNGWEFLKAFKKDEAFAGIPVVILSAFADRATIIGGDAISVLRKPINLNALFEVLEEQCSDKLVH